MKRFAAVLLMFTSVPAWAGGFHVRFVCLLEANHKYNAQNMQVRYREPMTYEDCLKKGQDLFESSVHAEVRLIHPFKDTITSKSWETQYKRVKITYVDPHGQEYTAELKRDRVQNSAVSVQEIQIESGWACWTQGDCDPVSTEN